MSRADKRQHRDHIVGTAKDAAVRLYAFANTRPAYHVVFSPERPVIVLKTKRAAGQHPCTQWAPFASLVFSRRPNTTHAVYVADATALPEMMEKEENIIATVGPVVRRLSNVLAKLNAHEATMVAAGVSAPLAFKYAVMGEKVLGHTDRLVRRLILVCPASVRPFQQIVKEMSKRAAGGDYPKPQLVVMVADASQAQQWEEWGRDSTTNGVSSVLDSYSIVTDLKPSLFDAVAREAGCTADGTTVNLGTHFSAPEVFRIDFVLSKDTKKTEQRVTRSPLTTTGCDDDDSDDGGGDDDGGGEEGGEVVEEEQKHSVEKDGCCDHAETTNVYGITALQHCRSPTRVIVDGRIMDAAATVLGTAQGRVKVHHFNEAANSDASKARCVKLKKGMAVRVESSLERDEMGRTTLRALCVTPLTRMQEKRSMMLCSMAEVPSYNVSTTSNAYGALLVRGRKCVLVRSHSGEFEGMRLPFVLHDDAEESAMDCTVRALCERCEISPDNFYIPSYIAPVCYYDRGSIDGVVVCVTLFVAFAVSPPSGGAGDTIEDTEAPEEPYDWFGYQKASNLLKTVEEKEAVKDLQRSLRRAHDAGLYSPLKGFGVFGDDVADLACSSPNKTSELLSLEGLELMVVSAPGDTEGRTVQLMHQVTSQRVMSVLESASRAEIEQYALAAVRGGAQILVLCLSSEIDIDAFSEELTYWSERGARLRVVTILLPGVSEMIMERQEGSTAAAFVHSAMLSDAVLTVDTDMEHFSPTTWGLLRLVSRLNSDAALYCGVTSRRPITFTPQTNVTSSSEASLHEVTIRRVGRPVIAARLAPLLESDGLRDCCRYAVVLWAQGDVWIKSRPHARGALTLDARSCCLSLEEGEPWKTHEEDEEKEEMRENVISLHVWATRAGLAELEEVMGGVMDGMLCSSTEDDDEDDTLPLWD